MKQVLLASICMLLIILFSYTASAKLIDLQLFKLELRNQPLPHWLTGILIYVLPVLEIVLALGIIINKYRFGSLIGSLVLMLLFTIYTMLVLFHFFPKVPCSCGGVIKYLNWKQHLFFNLFVDILIVWAIYLYKNVNQHKRIHA